MCVSRGGDHVLSVCAAPRAIPHALLIQLVVGPGRRPEAPAEVAGRTRAPPSGHNCYRQPGEITEAIMVGEMLCACCIVQAQYERDQQRQEAEWQKAKRDAIEEVCC